MRRMNVCCCTANSHSASTAPHLWDNDAITNGCRILHWHLCTWAKGTLEQEQYEKAHIGLRILRLLQNLFWNVQLSFKKTKATSSCNASRSYCAFKTVPTMLQMFSGGNLNYLCWRVAIAVSCVPCISVFCPGCRRIVQIDWPVIRNINEDNSPSSFPFGCAQH